MLPSAPDRALEGVVDGLMETLHTDSSKAPGGKKQRRRSSGSGHRESQVLIGAVLERGDFVDRLTLHM